MRGFKRHNVLLWACSLILVSASCAPHANPYVPDAVQQGDVAGFWRGVWHGLIVPFTFIVSLFSKATGVYEVQNNGGWYNFGFLLGLSMVFGGGGRGTAGRTGR